MTNKQKYIDFCKTEINIPVFSNPWWLDVVCDNKWDVILLEKDNKIIASMPYFLTSLSYFGILKSLKYKSITRPILTPSLGIYIKYPNNQGYYKKLSWDKKIITEILDKLPHSDFTSIPLNPNTTNILPYYWSGYEVSVKNSYVIKDIEIQDLLSSFQSKVRRNIKNLETNDISISEGFDIEEFYPLVKSTFQRKNMTTPYSQKIVSKIYQVCLEKNACKLFFARDKNNKLIAGNLLIFDQNTIYYIMGGINPMRKNLGAMDGVIFESIKFALSNKKTFDFEGSMIESIEMYFRSFGAKQRTYYSIKKINSNIFKRIQAFKKILKS